MKLGGLGTGSGFSPPGLARSSASPQDGRFLKRLLSFGCPGNIYEIEYSEQYQAKSAYGIHSVCQCLRSFDKHDDGECYLDYSEDYADDVQDRPPALFFQYFPEFHGWCQFILS